MELFARQTDKKAKIFFRQYNIGPYIADFYCPEARLVIVNSFFIFLPLVSLYQI